MAYATVDPASGQEIRSWSFLDADAVEDTLTRSYQGFQAWRWVPLPDRCDRLRALAGGLRADRDRHAALITAEMGKPVREARAEVEKCAWVCEHYADHAAESLADEVVETDARRSLVRHEPLGPVLAVMPWNFPYWQVYRFAAPVLAAGGTVLLKHAPNVSGCAEAITATFADAGFPDGTFLDLRIDVDAVPEVIADDRVRGVTLTGSVAAGRAVAAQAGAVGKPSVLELGGSDPFVVFEDADLDGAVEAAVQSRFLNSGQSCIAAKRFLVQDTVMDGFTDSFVARVEALRVGDPTDTGTGVGPLARADLLETLESQVADAVAGGATVLCGGSRLDRPGHFHAPTVLAHVGDGMRVWKEEVFGPVAPVRLFRDEDEAVKMANATRYGLGASIWTRDPDRTHRMVERLEAGAVFVNGMVKSDPRLPFGGVKDSGYGRELGPDGVRSFTQRKTVWLGAGP